MEKSSTLQSGDYKKSALEGVKIYARVKGISEAAASRMCGMSKAGIRNSPNLNSAAVSEFLRNNPDLSAEWLMRGEGEMLRTPKNEAHGDNSTNVAGDNSTVHVFSEPSPAYGTSTPPREPDATTSALLATLESQRRTIDSLCDELRYLRDQLSGAK